MPSTTPTLRSRAATLPRRARVRREPPSAIRLPLFEPNADESTTVSPRHSLTSPKLSPVQAEEPLYTCLFLPYLHFDSYKRLLRRRDVILKRLDQGRSRPVPEAVAKSDSLEMQVVWEFLGHDPPVNCRCTLDQYGYPSLRDTRSRDDDQMLYKLTKERACGLEMHERGCGGGGLSAQASTAGSGGSGREHRDRGGAGWRRDRWAARGSPEGDVVPAEETVLNGNVLMVDQLWLWVLHSREPRSPCFSSLLFTMHPEGNLPLPYN